jgi:hypothetical protein
MSAGPGCRACDKPRGHGFELPFGAGAERQSVEAPEITGQAAAETWRQDTNDDVAILRRDDLRLKILRRTQRFVFPEVGLSSTARPN